MGAVSHDDLGEHASFDHKIEVSPFKLFFKPEDLITDAGVFRVSLFKGKR